MHKRLYHEALWEMPANDIQLVKGYISPSALQYTAVSPFSSTHLWASLLYVCHLPVRLTLCDKYKVTPEVIYKWKYQRGKGQNKHCVSTVMTYAGILQHQDAL